ncbi:MAG: transposase [Phycisphaeraceae bacterium]
MPRRRREATGGIVFHVLNRAVARLTIFENDGDYQAFEKVLAQSVQRMGTRLLAYCLMPNHFHLVVWPRGDGELSQFMRLLTVTHTQRWHAHHHTSGTGPLYQGRFKSFPVQADEHYLALCRYVERNALRANLVERAQDWRWGSLWRRRAAAPGGLPGEGLILSSWPVAEPGHWLRLVNTPQRQAELEALRRCVRRGQPWGGPRWVGRVTRQLGLESAFRPRGRPPKIKQ